LFEPILSSEASTTDVCVRLFMSDEIGEVRLMEMSSLPGSKICGTLKSTRCSNVCGDC